MVNLKNFKFKLKMNDLIVYLCAFILTLMFLSLFYVNFLSPMTADLSAILSHKSVLEKQLEIKKQNLSNLSENLLLTAELQNGAAPRQIAAKDETTAVLYVMRMIEQCSLTETDFNILPREYTRDDRFLRPLQIKVSGSFDNCMRFLYNIQHGEYYCLPDKIEMHTQNSDDGKVYMSLSTYLIIENDAANSTPDKSTISDESTNSIIDPTAENTAENMKDKRNVRNPFFYAR